jgi:hypothetical protein
MRVFIFNLVHLPSFEWCVEIVSISLSVSSSMGGVMGVGCLISSARNSPHAQKYASA